MSSTSSLPMTNETTYRPPLYRSEPPMMDSIYVANLRAAVADRAGEPGSAMRREKARLREHRWQRGKLVFLDRMEVDVRGRRAYSEVCRLRRDPSCKNELDKRLNHLFSQPSSNKGGPVISTYPSHAVNHHHNRNYNWAPLECY